MYQVCKKTDRTEENYHNNTGKSRMALFLDRIMDRRVAVFMIVLMVLLLFSIIFMAVSVTAERPAGKKRLTASVYIESGDSLWSIAKEYYSPEYKSMEDYISVIKACNGLDSDLIHEGCYLVVPYYVVEPSEE